MKLFRLKHIEIKQTYKHIQQKQSSTHQCNSNDWSNEVIHISEGDKRENKVFWGFCKAFEGRAKKFPKSDDEYHLIIKRNQST